MSDVRNQGSAEAAPTKGEDTTPRKKRSGRIVIAIVIAAAAVGAWFLFVPRGSQYTDDASIKGDQIVVSAQILGQVTYMAVDEQDQVTKGQVLVRLDDLSLRAQESQALANKEFAAQNIDLAQVKLDQAQSDLHRATVQLQDKIIPQEQYDHLSIAFSSAQTQYKIAQAQEKIAEAEYATVEANLQHSVMESPVDGIVAKKWTMPGNIVQPAQPIYTLYNLNDLWVEANFKETQIHLLRPGDRAVITVDAFPGLRLAGKVKSIGSATASEFALIPPDNATGNFTKVTQRVPVKILIDDIAAAGNAQSDDPVLVPGLSVEVRVSTGAR
jgi:membrane fusion protein (multidrug efflux system)